MKENFSEIQSKLESFTNKFYKNQLIKGGILFFTIGILYFLLTLFIEYMLWLNTIGRSILFWVFIIVEAVLLFKFILIPISRLFKLRKGISYEEASEIIGNHFPNVNDKLVNILQLSENDTKSELLLASIDQRAKELKPIPFNIAINFKDNLKYIKYSLIPIFIIVIIWLTGNYDFFSSSYKRVVNYNVAYEPPAPFEFLVVNNSLKAVENQNFEIYINTVGDVLPDEVAIFIDNEKYFLQQSSVNSFKHTISRVTANTSFYLEANGIRSRAYEIEVLKVPTLLDFQMELTYPEYIKKSKERIKNTGNAVIPEGTSVNWIVHSKQTDAVEMIMADTLYHFTNQGENFSLNKRLYSDFYYEIAISNKEVKRHEQLGFNIEIVKDKYPDIQVNSKKDTVNAGGNIFNIGEVSDDYGIRKLEVVFYPKGSDEVTHNRINIPIKSSTFDQFSYAFPNQIELEEGLVYEFYFEVTDNDAIHGGKKTKSQIFSFRNLTTSELKDEELFKQEKTIKNIDKGIDKLKNQQKELQDISRLQKEKKKLNFNDKRKLQNFINRQKQQDELMRNFTKDLQKNLENINEENKEDPFNELLKERLERQQKELEKNEKLLEELEKLNEKLDKEELSRKIERLAKQQKNNERSLEQLLELTKRYYVETKAQKLKDDLFELARKQDSLSRQDEKNTKEAQDELNNEFKKLKEDFEELEKSNEELKKPIEFKRNEEEEFLIERLQKEASENLEDTKAEDKQGENKNQQQKEKAKKRQKQAATKLKELGDQLASQLQQGGQEGEAEDAESLRQILDNLVLFSFDQEAVLDKFSEFDSNSANFAKNLRKQNDLRTLFQHVDDSLFALSLRRPEISERINNEITNVYFNIDKALDRLAQNRIGEGVASQQYALTAANNLADFLSQVLDNMQQSMGNGQGNSKSKGFQLPDIIQSQEQINQQFQKGLNKQKGEQGNEGEKGKNGQEGEDSKGNKEGKKEGQNNGQGTNGNGNGGEEGLTDELYEIFKQQQQLRQSLEEQLKDKYGNGNEGNAEKLLKEIEDVEDDLLENGFNENTLQKLTKIKHELLKLENASFEQGKKDERESTTNRKVFTNKSIPTDEEIRQYFNQVEILNRQALPLRQIYKKKVQSYFKEK